jgi:hypothetical protein
VPVDGRLTAMRIKLADVTALVLASQHRIMLSRELTLHARARIAAARDCVTSSIALMKQVGMICAACSRRIGPRESAAKDGDRVVHVRCLADAPLGCDPPSPVADGGRPSPVADGGRPAVGSEPTD